MDRRLFLLDNELYLLKILELLKNFPQGLTNDELYLKLHISEYRLKIVRLFFFEKQSELSLQKKIFWRKRSGINILQYQNEAIFFVLIRRIIVKSPVFLFLSRMIQLENTSVKSEAKRVSLSEKKVRQNFLMFKSHLINFGFKISSRGLKIDGDEGMIREVLFQFFQETFSNDNWPEYFCDSLILESIIKKMLSHFSDQKFSEPLKSQLKIYLGIQLLRMKQQHFYSSDLNDRIFNVQSSYYQRFRTYLQEFSIFANFPSTEVVYLYFIFIYLGVIPVNKIFKMNSKQEEFLSQLETFFGVNKTAKILPEILYLLLGKQAVIENCCHKYSSKFQKDSLFSRCLKLAQVSIKFLELWSLDERSLANFYCYQFNRYCYRPLPMNIYIDHEECLKEQVESLFSRFHYLKFVKDEDKYQADIIISHFPKTYEFYSENQKQIFVKEELDAYDFGKLNTTLLEVSKEKNGKSEETML